MTGEILLQLLLGGLLGMVGQSLRVVVGLKKLNDDASDTGQKLKDVFVGSRMVISLLIGFVAGLLAVVSISSFDPHFFSGPGLKQVILSLLAAGYAGTDFIEGFIVKFLPNTPAPDPGGQTTDPGDGTTPADAYSTSLARKVQPVVAIPTQGAITHP